MKSLPLLLLHKHCFEKQHFTFFIISLFTGHIFFYLLQHTRQQQQNNYYSIIYTIIFNNT